MMLNANGDFGESLMLHKLIALRLYSPGNLRGRLA